MNFARGLCQKGNLADKKREYTWEDSDQPGLWYALTRAHSDFSGHTKTVRECNLSTGLIDTNYAYMDGMSEYFESVGIHLGCEVFTHSIHVCIVCINESGGEITFPYRTH